MKYFRVFCLGLLFWIWIFAFVSTKFWFMLFVFIYYKTSMQGFFLHQILFLQPTAYYKQKL